MSRVAETHGIVHGKALGARHLPRGSELSEVMSQVLAQGFGPSLALPCSMAAAPHCTHAPHGVAQL